MADHCSSRLIPEGAELPLLDDMNGVLKVMSDFRTPVPESPSSNRGSITNQELFLERIRQMKTERVYSGRPAFVQARFDDEEDITRFVRTVAYYRAAPSGEQLGGIGSNRLAALKMMPIIGVKLLPKLRVGTTYERGPTRPTGAQAIRARSKRPQQFSALPHSC
jgi:hypothetical protein